MKYRNTNLNDCLELDRYITQQTGAKGLLSYRKWLEDSNIRAVYYKPPDDEEWPSLEAVDEKNIEAFIAYYNRGENDA